MPDETNKSAKNMDQGAQSERQRGEDDQYKRTMTDYDASKQDENFDGTMKSSEENSLDERDTNDGDANNENNY